MKKYKHIFFDLDRTLWDFDKSSKEAFEEIFNNLGLRERGIDSVDKLYRKYTVHNEKLWDLYREGKLAKEELRGLRFHLTLKDFGIDDRELADKFGNEYIRISPLKANLFPRALNILEYLKPKYKLHIITNGFSEVQDIKIKTAGLNNFFDKIITSEEAGTKKPDTKIFEYALKKANANPNESLMIGDDFEVDIIGAINAGIDQVLFDPKREYTVKSGIPTFYITCLDEIKNFL